MSSSELYRVCHVSEIAEGTAGSVEIAGQRLGLYNIGGKFFAIDDRCTHAMAFLSEGHIDGDTVECPLHGGCFHIPTGRPLTPPVRTPVRVYPVHVIDDQVYIQIDDDENEQEP
jgi:nitrite reductase/ring-hydroxylating ferredoxin subunit